MQNLVDKLFSGNSSDFEVTISVKKRETKEEANTRIDRALDNIEQKRNLVAFSSEEYDSLVNQLSKQ